MAYDAGPQHNNRSLSDYVTLDYDHPEDGSEDVKVLDTIGLAGGSLFVSVLSTGGTAAVAVEEGATHLADADEYEEVASATTSDGVLETIRVTPIQGGAFKVKVTASVATKVYVLAH